MNAGPGPLLSVRDLNVYLGPSHVLQGISFDVPRGGVTALLGRNGVGKTTTIRSLLGLVRPRGSVMLDGAELSKLPTHKIVGRGVEVRPRGSRGLRRAHGQETSSSLSGTAGSLRPCPRAVPGLHERAEQKAGTLSGGQQQMVAIGRALLNENRILLVDEPTKGLAPLLVTEVARVLERVSETETMLLVEQNLGVVRRIARDAIVLDAGHVTYSGSAEALLSDPDQVNSLLGVAGGAH